MNSVTIIGSGLAGYNLAKEIRKLDKTMPITVITADGGESYSKPMLSNALSKGKTAQQLVISDAPKMASQLSATIQVRTRVMSINPEQKEIETELGKFTYDRLVMALGASQNRLSINGDASDEIVSINDLDDYTRFQDQLAQANDVVIIGAGLIGCEFANDLLSANKKVTVLGLGDTPLDRLLIPEIGEKLQAALGGKGVAWQLGVTVDKMDFSEGGKKYRLTISDGSIVEADIVLSATGLTPNIKLAKQAGIRVNRGIVVDRYLQTSEEDIFAVGDCIEIDELVLAYVLPIMNGVRALARTLTEEKTRVSYPAMPVVVKTPDYPMVISPPAMGATGEWQVQSDEAGVKALFVGQDDQIKGFVLTDKKVVDKQSLTKRLPPVLS